MKTYVGQIEVEYCYNPYGKYFNLWFYRHKKCVFIATLFNRDMFVESVHEVGDMLRYRGLQTYKAWLPETHDLIIEGMEWKR